MAYLHIYTRVSNTYVARRMKYLVNVQITQQRTCHIAFNNTGRQTASAMLSVTKIENNGSMQMVIKYRLILQLCTPQIYN